MMAWLKAPWFIGYSTLRNMAVFDSTAQHTCQVCGAAGSNKKTVKDPWCFMTGAMRHFLTSASCLASLLLNSSSPDIDGEYLIPSTLELLQGLIPSKCARDFLPPLTILYMCEGRNMSTSN